LNADLKYIFEIIGFQSFFRYFGDVETALAEF